MIRDTHCHIEFTNMPLDETIAHLEKYMKKFDVEAMTILMLPQQVGSPDDVLANLKALYVKKKMQPRMYAYMGLRHYYDGRDTKESYLEQLTRGMEMGFDGVKLIDGKPDFRKRLGRRLDDPCFDLFFEKAQRDSIPIILHACDPQENWDKTKCSPVAIERGWCYDAPGFRTCEEIYSEVDGILEKFPKLDLCLAHFYFMSYDLRRAEKFLDAHPTVSFDLTPGTEMYFGFSKEPELTKRFFDKFHERIYFGTDLDNERGCDDWYEAMYPLVWNFLTSKEPIYFRNKEITPLGWDKDDRRVVDISYENHVRRNGKMPNMLNAPAIREEIERTRSENLSDEQKKVLEEISRYMEE